jgi:cytidyltransferase-like protein
MRVFTMGTFDLFHAGHVEFLRKCRYLSVPPGGFGADGEVIVGLNTDAFAESYKRRPTIDYAGREAVLLACRFVDEVVPNDQPGGSAMSLVETVAPDIIAATMDYHPSNGKDWFAQVGVPAEWFRERHIDIEWIPYTEGVSSSAITARL